MDSLLGTSYVPWGPLEYNALFVIALSTSSVFGIISNGCPGVMAMSLTALVMAGVSRCDPPMASFSKPFSVIHCPAARCSGVLSPSRITFFRAFIRSLNAATAAVWFTCGMASLTVLNTLAAYFRWLSNGSSVFTALAKAPRIPDRPVVSKAGPTTFASGAADLSILAALRAASYTFGDCTNLDPRLAIMGIAAPASCPQAAASCCCLDPSGAINEPNPPPAIAATDGTALARLATLAAGISPIKFCPTTPGMDDGLSPSSRYNWVVWSQSLPAPGRALSPCFPVARLYKLTGIPAVEFIAAPSPAPKSPSA
jgi:hypothetical protein